jgi:hypothetical protein
MLNPDNMIVSDSLKDRVTTILSDEPDATSFSAELTIGDQALILGLSRFEQSKNKTVFLGTCEKSAIKPVLSLQTSMWRRVRVLCDGEALFDLSLLGQQLEVSYDFSSSSNLCAVTLACVAQATKTTKRVL